MSRVTLPGKNNVRVIALPHLAVTMSAESDALAVATVANWLSAEGWRTDLGKKEPGQDVGQEQWFEAYPQFEIDIECDAAETLTGTPQLYAARLAPVTIADDTFTSSTDTHTATAHALLDGDGPVQLTTSDTLPAGLSLLTNYYVEYASVNTFKLHTTRAGAIAKDSATLITTTDGGTGTHTLSDVQSSANLDDDTRRFRHTLVGKLNEGNDITVAAQTAYMERINHSPLDLYYIVKATETAAQTITVRITPVMLCER